MNDKIVMKAPAKINLFLEIKKKRADGYHEIETVMQEIGLYDQIDLSYDTSEEGIFLTSNKKKIPTNENNVAYRAAKLFLETSGIHCGLRLHLKKQIPVAAGLGGGSTDAAAVFKGLNTLFHTGYSLEELASMGATLGADIPFCINGGAVLATGIGEILEPLPSLKSLIPVVAIGSKPSSTPIAYRLLDEHHYVGSKSAASTVEALRSGSTELLINSLYNAFEDVIYDVNTEAKKLKAAFLKNGSLGTLLSGSGASVFGLFDHKKDALACRNILRDQGYFAVAAPIENEENG